MSKSLSVARPQPSFDLVENSSHFRPVDRQTKNARLITKTADGQTKASNCCCLCCRASPHVPVRVAAAAAAAAAAAEEH
eukprot:scaffold10040_cov102-Amphora_coffeaeformis.AAC.1